MKGYNIKVRLKNFKPITWRDLIIPPNITFKGLHEIIQIIMGFDNSHLYDFSFKDSRYNIIDFETNEDQFLAFDSDSVCINKFFDNYKKIGYTYNYFYMWDMTIEIKGEVDFNKDYPEFIRFKGNNLIDDSYEINNIISSISKKFGNPNEIDAEKVNEFLIEKIQYNPEQTQNELKELNLRKVSGKILEESDEVFNKIYEEKKKFKKFLHDASISKKGLSNEKIEKKETDYQSKLF